MTATRKRSATDVTDTQGTKPSATSTLANLLSSRSDANLLNSNPFAIERQAPVSSWGFFRTFFRAFLDFFVLFSGVSTASNLSRTQPRPVRSRGLFLFRGTARKPADRSPVSR
jgi:hypothetical protein